MCGPPCLCVCLCVLVSNCSAVSGWRECRDNYRLEIEVFGSFGWAVFNTGAVCSPPTCATGWRRSSALHLGGISLRGATYFGTYFGHDLLWPRSHRLWPRSVFGIFETEEGKKEGARRVGARRVGARRVGAQNFVLFSLSHPPFLSLFSLWGLLEAFWWCFCRRDPQMCALLPSGCRVKTPGGSGGRGGPGCTGGLGYANWWRLCGQNRPSQHGWPKLVWPSAWHPNRRELAKLKVVAKVGLAAACPWPKMVVAEVGCGQSRLLAK